MSQTSPYEGKHQLEHTVEKFRNFPTGPALFDLGIGQQNVDETPKRNDMHTRPDSVEALTTLQLLALSRCGQGPRR